MDIEEIKAFLEENKDEESVKEFLASLNGSSESHEFTSDEFVEYIKSENGEPVFNAAMKPFLDKEGDRRANEAVRTYERDTLPKKVDATVAKKLKELNPEETQEQRRIRELEQRVIDGEKKGDRDKLMFAVVKKAEERGIPARFVEKLTAETEQEFDEQMDWIDMYLKERDKKTANDVLKVRDKPKDDEREETPKVADLAGKSFQDIMAMEESGKLDQTLESTGR